jgi:hypothetical protein
MPEVDWRGLSPRSKRILRMIASPVAAGYTVAEIAEMLQKRREEIADLRPPDPVTRDWVGARLRELRKDADASPT